jgi:hypothetical protein
MPPLPAPPTPKLTLFHTPLDTVLSCIPRGKGWQMYEELYPRSLYLLAVGKGKHHCRGCYNIVLDKYAVHSFRKDVLSPPLATVITDITRLIDPYESGCAHVCTMNLGFISFSLPSSALADMSAKSCRNVVKDFVENVNPWCEIRRVM